ncbi:hypothetical protein Goshw_017580 [Gossypium schwendimanii]|uniref:TatD related DNase n=1 Tax=Gossypium schwendimanii TaxID=34291 RepID=A0A7J9LGJ1_GOSSC|nr:hypothetical protein [Gossypium schwendimanii]
MFKGIYNGKQHHVSDIATVLSRAWNAGVDRIIVSYPIFHILFAFYYVWLLTYRNSSVPLEAVTGGSLEESKEALAIAETDGLFIGGFSAQLECTQLDARLVLFLETLSLEFEESGDPEKHFQGLLALAKEGIQKGKVVAIGECGLDYDRLHFCPPEVQKKYFEKQFELAYATKLPMFLHMRAAAEDFCEIMERNINKLDF